MHDPLAAISIRQFVHDQCHLDLDVVVHERIDSTSQWCLDQLRQGRTAPFACFAEQQTAGRGRRGKQWHSADNASIALSMAWAYDPSKTGLQFLPLSVALEITRLLEALEIDEVKIKWPNDVYVKGSKIAGILVETYRLPSAAAPAAGPAGNMRAAIIGVGLNYDMRACEAVLTADGVTCTDIRRQFTDDQPLPSRLLVAKTLLARLVQLCSSGAYASGECLDVFRRHYDYCKGRQVQVVQDSGAILTGIAIGVTDDAEICIDAGGEVCCFNSADVSIRP
jgi:BirA family biotin operon repressor/biotin-[acetyl-CoA-carboxylase] ligase